MFFMIFGIGGCNFVRMNGLGWGLFWREETAAEAELTSRKIHCTAFEDSQKDEFDGAFKFARFCAFLVLIIGVLATAASCSLGCSTLNNVTLKSLGAVFLVVSLLQCFAFFLLLSELCDTTYSTEFDDEQENCKISFGSGLAVGSIVFSLLAGIQALAHPVIPYSSRKQNQEDHIENAVIAEESVGNDAEPDGEERTAGEDHSGEFHPDEEQNDTNRLGGDEEELPESHAEDSLNEDKAKQDPDPEKV